MADKLTATEKELYNLRYNITAMGSELTIFRELKVKLDKYFQDVLRQIATVSNHDYSFIEDQHFPGCSVMSLPVR